MRCILCGAKMTDVCPRCGFSPRESRELFPTLFDPGDAVPSLLSQQRSLIAQLMEQARAAEQAVEKLEALRSRDVLDLRTKEAQLERSLSELGNAQAMLSQVRQKLDETQVRLQTVEAKARSFKLALDSARLETQTARQSLQEKERRIQELLRAGHIESPSAAGSERTVQRCGNLYVEIFPDSVRVVGARETAVRNLEIPAQIQPNLFSREGARWVPSPSVNVASIAPRVFAGRTDLETLSIPECVAEIGTEAFRGCTHLRSAVLPAHVNIHPCAFARCAHLERVTFFSTGQEKYKLSCGIAANAFSGCSQKLAFVAAEGGFPIEYARAHSFRIYSIG